MKKLIEHYKHNWMGIGAILASLFLGTVTWVTGGSLFMIIFFYSITLVVIVGDWLSLR